LMAVVAAVVVSIAIRGTDVTDFTAAANPVRLRAGNFRIAGEMIADHPWVGVGPGGFAEVYPQYRGPEDNESRHVHDLPLELCAEWGVPAGIGLTIVFGLIFLGPLMRNAPGRPTWVIGASIGLAALVLQNLLDFTMLLPSLLWLAAAVRGSIASYSPAVPSRPSLPAIKWAVLATVLAAAAISGLAGGAWNARFHARQALVEGRIEDAVGQLARSTRMAPWNPDGWLYRAQIASGGAVVDSEPPEVLIERAFRLAPIRPAVRMTRARLRAVAGDLPGAYAEAAKASSLYPLSMEYARSRDEIATLLQTTSR